MTSNLPSSGSEARKLGASRFFTGRPCSRGHIAERYSKGGNCVSCLGVTDTMESKQRGAAIRAGKQAEEAWERKENTRLRSVANERKEPTYVPSKCCVNGHFLRYSSSNNCVHCDKDTMQKHKVTKQYSRIFKTYGLLKDAYLKMVSDQNSCCYLCGKKQENHFSLHVDHCHSTGKVRALLCGNCNQALGLFKENLELIRKAAEYLKRHKDA